MVNDISFLEKTILFSMYYSGSCVTATAVEKEALEANGFLLKQIIQTPVKCSGANAPELASSSIDNATVDINSVVKNDNDKIIITILKGIQCSINDLQSEMQSYLKKMSDLDHTVQDLKNDNVLLRTMAKGFADQDQFTNKLKQQELDTAHILDQVQYLNKTVESLKNQNDTLKSCFQTFIQE